MGKVGCVLIKLVRCTKGVFNLKKISFVYVVLLGCTLVALGGGKEAHAMGISEAKVIHESRIDEITKDVNDNKVKIEELLKIKEDEKRGFLLLDLLEKYKESDLNPDNDKLEITDTLDSPSLGIKGLKVESTLEKGGITPVKETTLVTGSKLAVVSNKLVVRTDMLTDKELEKYLKSMGKEDSELKAKGENILKIAKEIEEINKDISNSEIEIFNEENKIKELDSFFYPAVGVVTSPFGWRVSPMGGGEMEFHKGVDISGGGNICATNVGTVIKASYGDNGGAGNVVEIDHGDFNGKRLVSMYFHLSSINVRVGDVVSKGQVVGVMGTSGRSTGLHLHFQVEEDGVAVDPFNYISK